MAYTAALVMLARRELSETQVRQRLARRGHPPEDIDAAVARLKADGSLDDARVAGAIARTQTGIRGRGPHRVRRQIEAAGIAAPIAAKAVDEVFQDVDSDTLLAAALERRLRGRDRIEDDREFSRLYRYLIGQGFDSARVVAALTKIRTR